MKLSRRLFCALPFTAAGAKPARVVLLPVGVEVETLNFRRAAAFGEVMVRLVNTELAQSEALTRTRCP